MNEEELIGLLRQGGNARSRRGRSCPGETAIIAFARGHSLPASRKRLERHIADCSFCLGQVGFVVRSEELETPTEVPTDLVTRIRQLRRSQKAGGQPFVWNWRHLSTATAAVALVGLIWLSATDRLEVSQKPSRTPPPVRGAELDLQSPTLAHPQEGDVIDAGGTDLRWAAVPQALFYRVSITTSTGDLVWEAQVEDPRVWIPTDAVLEPGRQCYVWVEAHLQGGEVVTSPVVGFQVAPR